MKKLFWKKKKYGDLTFWMSEIKTVGWQFSIEEIDKETYQAFIYYGRGEDHPILPYGVFLSSLKEAQRVCNDWLHNTIVNLNKWY